MAKTAQNKSSLVGLKELRENMEKYIKATKRGRSFTVLRRSKPVFKIMPVDEWGDEGVWETVIDFTEINPRGVPAKDILDAFQRMQKKDKLK